MVLFRQFVFQNIQMEGILSDLVAVLAILCVTELAASVRWKAFAFCTVNLVISFLLFASTIYYSYYNTVPIYTALYGLDQVGQIKGSVEASIQFTNYLFFLDNCILAVIYGVNRFKGGRLSGTNRIAKPWQVLIALILCLALSVFYSNNVRSVANERVQAESLGFLNYQVTAAVKANKDRSSAKNETEQSIAKLVEESQRAHIAPAVIQGDATGVKGATAAASPAYFGAAKGMNVIVVQLEAFQNFAIHLSIDEQVVTPVLNQLALDSFYFPHFYQTIGQGNTSDAEFMSNTSIYPTGVIAMSTGYGDRIVPSLPRLLKKDNYESNTFHINDITFWNRDKMYPALGFTKYYDKPYFTNDKFNAFGASDIELYRVGIEKLSALQQQDVPFYAQFITTSSHHPFKIPKGQQRIKMPKSLQGKQLGDYLLALNYSDYALGKFIEDLKEKGMWDHSVLVVYGDHFGLQPKDNEAAWVSEQLGIKYNEKVSRFNIPLFVHVPGLKGGLQEQQAGGQVDIMPTIANLLGISLKDESYLAFGHDLLNTDENVVGMRYYLPTGSFFNKDILFVPGKGFEDGTATDLRTLEPVTDFSKYRKDYDYILNLMQLSDKFVQLLPFS